MKVFRKDQSEFKPATDSKIGYYLNLSVEWGGWMFAWKHLLVLVIFLIAIGLWNGIGSRLASAVLSEAGGSVATLLVRAVGLIWMLRIFLRTGQNYRRLLVVLGFLPLITLKGLVQNPRPAMRVITRLGSYLLLAGEFTALFWWWLVDSTENLWWGEQLWFYWPALIVTWVLAFLGCLHLERVWFIGKTRLPLWLAIALSIPPLNATYRHILTLDVWWVRIFGELP